MGAPTTSTTSAPSLPRTNDNAPNLGSEANLEATYTSLVQQYLQVMCLDNATFLAERMVATCKTANAFYLLAVCHYRSSSPQRALMVLDQVKDHNSSTKYLQAKCCYDLEQYGRAEEALLQQARADYKTYKLTTSVSPLSIDEWIVQASPSPIPNGAAGLYLLANTCRRSNRKNRAMDYYRMSLQVSILCIVRLHWFQEEKKTCTSLTTLDFPLWTFLARSSIVDQLRSSLRNGGGRY